MARRWVERDHPRHPGESPGGVGGQFRERVGSGGWATRLNSMLGGRRGATEYQVGRAGGRSDLIDGPSTADDDIAQEDVGYIASDIGGTPSSREMALRMEALGDPERARRAFRLLRAGQQEGIRTHLGIESYGVRGRSGDYTPQATVDQFNEQAILDKLFPEAHRARLRGMAEQERMDEGGNLPRLTSQEVAQALGSDRATHNKYNDHIRGEAIAAEEENRADGDSDEELLAQLRIVNAAKARGDLAAWDSAVDHLRRMLTLSYLDEDELPPLPTGRRSGTSGV
jgi:hypothetical protein